MSLGARLVKARLDRNVTQKQLATYLRLPQSAISMIETGELDPAKETARLITDWILSGKGITINAPRGARGTYK
jgi:transcriptional regulator with XRE-family HTH domain